jgi:hypothetical protein
MFTPRALLYAAAASFSLRKYPTVLEDPLTVICVLHRFFVVDQETPIYRLVPRPDEDDGLQFILFCQTVAGRKFDFLLSRPS